VPRELQLRLPPGRGVCSGEGRRASANLAREARIEAETLVIWGERDPALGLELLDGLEEVAPRVRIRRLLHAGHWVQREEPVAVNRLLTDFLRRHV